MSDHGDGHALDGLIRLESCIQRTGGITAAIIGEAKLRVAAGDDLDRWVQNHPDPELAWCAVWCAVSGINEIMKDEP